MNHRFQNNNPRGFFYGQAFPYVQPAMANPPAAAGNPFVYPQNLPNAVMLIQQALAGETEDRMFYQWLIENAPSEQDKTIIAGIRDNEITHFALFRQLYQEITGQQAPPPKNMPFTPPETYCSGLGRALLGEQNAVQRYRQILYAMQSRVHMNILTEIITDEIRHGILYSYLYSKNGCRG